MGDLTFAGMISGAGQAAIQGLQTTQAGMIQSELIRQREEIDNRRLQLQETYAKARELRGYAHSEKMAAEGREFQRGVEQERRGADIVAKSTEYQRLQETELRHELSAKALRKQINNELIEFTKAKASDPTYKAALTELANADDGRLEKAQADLAEYKVKTKEEDRLLAIKQFNATQAALLMRDTTADIDRLSGLVTKAQVANDQVEVDRLTAAIKRSEQIQTAARQRVAELSDIKLGSSTGTDIMEEIAKADPHKTPTASPASARKAAPAAPSVGESKRNPAVEKAEREASKNRGLIDSEQPDTLATRAVKAVISESKRQLSPSTVAPKMTVRDVEDFIKFSADPRFVEAYIKRFGSAPSESDYEALRKSRQTKR
jgi:hypothetical protein